MEKKVQISMARFEYSNVGTSGGLRIHLPVSSNKACLSLSELDDSWLIIRNLKKSNQSKDTHIPNVSATPGKYQIGPTAVCPMFTSTLGSASLGVPLISPRILEGSLTMASCMTIKNHERA